MVLPSLAKATSHSHLHQICDGVSRAFIFFLLEIIWREDGPICSWEKMGARTTWTTWPGTCCWTSFSPGFLLSEMLFVRMKWDENINAGCVGRAGLHWQVEPPSQDSGYLLQAHMFILAGKDADDALCFLERGLWYAWKEAASLLWEAAPKARR